MDTRLVLIDSGDGRSGDELARDLAAQLIQAQDTKPASAERYASVTALLQKETEDHNGREFEWDEMPGARVHITGNLAVVNQYAKSVKKVRDERGMKPKDDLSVDAGHTASAYALFDGHGVEGWSGVVLEEGGEAWPFNRDNFVKLYRASKTFRHFIAVHFNRLSGIAKEAREADKGE